MSAIEYPTITLGDQTYHCKFGLALVREMELAGTSITEIGQKFLAGAKLEEMLALATKIIGQIDDKGRWACSGLSIEQVTQGVDDQTLGFPQAFRLLSSLIGDTLGKVSAEQIPEAPAGATVQ